MALPAKQPQHPPARGAPPEYHQYAWPLRADRACQTHGSHGMLPSPDEGSMNSWEARAFAEDTSSLAAGTWPPRAYPCSFCHREFRSAQALGGHMNVHRRDRARMRHSSPPAPLFCAPQNISLQPAATIIHKFQHGYSFSTGDVNPSAACPHIYPNEILSKANVLEDVPPTALPLPALSPKSSTASLAARYPSHMATSFPLRLHLLASEAASTLMLPEAEAMNQLSLWPASAIDSGNGCRSSTAIDARIKLGSAADNSSWSVPSSSSTSSSSLLVLKAGTPHVTPSMGPIPCKRARHIDVPSLIQLEDESPRKKCNVANNSDYPPHNQDISLKSCSKDDGIMIEAEPQKHETSSKSDIHVDESSMCTMQQERVKACGGECVDLELRLGQRPPYPPADYHQTSATAPVW